MTIKNLKSTFKTVSKVSVSPQSSDYHPSILSSFAGKVANATTPPLTNKINLHIANSGTSGRSVFQNFIQHLNDGDSGAKINTTSFPKPIIPLTIPKKPSITFELGQSTIGLAPHVSFTGVAVTPQDSSGHGSVNAPTIEPNASSYTGEVLQESEKPYILGIFSQNIVSGMPQRNLLFIKAINSKTKKATRYTLRKKDLFLNTDFVNIYDAKVEELVPISKYQDVVAQNPTLQEANFVIEDSSLSKNSVYVYKLYIEWVNMAADEIASAARMRASFTAKDLGLGTLPLRIS